MSFPSYPSDFTLSLRLTHPTLPLSLPSPLFFLLLPVLPLSFSSFPPFLPPIFTLRFLSSYMENPIFTQFSYISIYKFILECFNVLMQLPFFIFWRGIFDHLNVWIAFLTVDDVVSIFDVPTETRVYCMCSIWCRRVLIYLTLDTVFNIMLV